ncbi:MAG: DUF2309 domain-containing protein [Sulfobacillus acidophilus]|uniref:Probable inorganic carbon transporter subunit DabA n=1 Tax=Sulfobacillus acidophilus TaxID=53633 RepID=A0A2T2WLT5_9FIRM|nr:MAG: DUF2309 domain-containing protein [Sulfobacillus acidophilus]
MNDTLRLPDIVNAVCRRIAPLWPLKHFVAVNPYVGLSHQAFWQAHETLERITGTGLCMPRAYYREQMVRGRITTADVAQALKTLESPWDVPAFERLLARNTPTPARPFQLVTDILAQLDGQDWSNFVVERISRYCAAYFDEGQALWSMPWRDEPLYSGWLAFAGLDKSPRVMGVRGIRQALATWPRTAQDAIAGALRELDLPEQVVDSYLHAALLSVGGWAGWTRYLGWQAEQRGQNDDSIQDLLAIRVTWDALIHQLCYSEALAANWRQSLRAITQPAAGDEVGLQIDTVLHTALEVGYQRQLVTLLDGARGAVQPPNRPDVQAVFCIDVRSEIYRRALETVAPKVQTLGFAGFFGIPMEYLPFGGLKPERHLPVFFNPSYRIAEGLGGATARVANTERVRRQRRIRVVQAWKAFKTSAASTFAFVEAAGLFSAPKLISDCMGWTRPLPPPHLVGLAPRISQRLKPMLTAKESGSASCPAGGLTGMPKKDRVATAESVLRHMGLIQHFARLILLVGHGSATTNNPQATSLDCAACQGQSGEPSARIAAALLNDPWTRHALMHRGINIPTDTHFIAALHNTTTDDVELLNLDAVPPSHQADLVQLRRWLSNAGQLARLERANLLGLSDCPASAIHTDLRRRARNWAEVRPEWGLAGNAAFIAAPRSRTAPLNLAGRAFLHEYNWRRDTGFAVLKLIMTAPMIVAHWINMLYYGSMVDNSRWGSGNKILHNVVGGSIGVLEGNQGDLRGGLAWQSLHDGRQWMHEPMRLTVVIEAPSYAIEEVITHDTRVQELIENAWIHLFQIDADGHVHRRGLDKKWYPYPSPDCTKPGPQRRGEKTTETP